MLCLHEQQVYFDLNVNWGNCVINIKQFKKIIVGLVFNLITLHRENYFTKTKTFDFLCTHTHTTYCFQTINTPKSAIFVLSNFLHTLGTVLLYATFTSELIQKAYIPFQWKIHETRTQHFNWD